jgi:hypothetical protein
MRGASILLTSYTNSAVDNLLIKLKAQVITTVLSSCITILMFGFFHFISFSLSVTFYI